VISGLKLPHWTSLVCTAAELLLQLVVALLQLAAVELQAMAAGAEKAENFCDLNSCMG